MISKNTWYAKINTDKHFVEMSMCVSECYDLSDNRLAFIAVFARTHVRSYIRSMREVEPSERYFRRCGEKLPSIPLHVDDFSASYPSDTLDKLHVRTMPNHGQDDMKFPLWKSTFVRQMQLSASLFVRISMLGIEHF